MPRLDSNDSLFSCDNHSALCCERDRTHVNVIHCVLQCRIYTMWNSHFLSFWTLQPHPLKGFLLQWTSLPNLQVTWCFLFAKFLVCLATAITNSVIHLLPNALYGQQQFAMNASAAFNSSFKWVRPESWEVPTWKFANFQSYWWCVDGSVDSIHWIPTGYPACESKCRTSRKLLVGLVSKYFEWSGEQSLPTNFLLALLFTKLVYARKFNSIFVLWFALLEQIVY